MEKLFLFYTYQSIKVGEKFLLRSFLVRATGHVYAKEYASEHPCSFCRDTDGLFWSTSKRYKFDDTSDDKGVVEFLGEQEINKKAYDLFSGNAILGTS